MEPEVHGTRFTRHALESFLPAQRTGLVFEILVQAPEDGRIAPIVPMFHHLVTGDRLLCFVGSSLRSVQAHGFNV